MLAVLQRRTSDVPAQKCDGKIISKHPVRLLLDLDSQDFLLDVQTEASPGVCHS